MAEQHDNQLGEESLQETPLAPPNGQAEMVATQPYESQPETPAASQEVPAAQPSASQMSPENAPQMPVEGMSWADLQSTRKEWCRHCQMHIVGCPKQRVLKKGAHASCVQILPQPLHALVQESRYGQIA